MEEVPFKIVVGLIVASMVVYIGIVAVQSYIDLQTRKGFVDDLIKIKSTMKMLVSTSDLGSFARVHIIIPKDCSLKFQGSKMIVNYFGKTRKYDIPGQIVKTREYGPGEYWLVIYYGNPSKEDPYMVAFK